jgi:hypothetical protein
MTSLPTLYCIHASDAPQHMGQLETILTRMKAENRIADFTALDMSTSPTNPSVKDADQQGIVLLLTNEIGRLKTEVEKLINSIVGESQKIKLIEIIVDNLPYHNHFISFPQDLTPIRNRVDMNLVWKGIEQDLIELFPQQIVAAPHPIPPTGSKKYLKLIGLSVLSGTAGLLFFAILFKTMTEDIGLLLTIFSFLLPIIVFLFYKKKLELFGSLTQEPRRVSGAINWKQLFRKTGTAFVFFLELYLILSVLLILMFGGSFQHAYPAYLAMPVTLLILFYRSKRESLNLEVQENEVQPRPKRFLKFFAISLLVLFVTGAFWASILINIPSTQSDSQSGYYNYYLERDTYIFTLPILTTACLLMIQRRKRPKPFSLEKILSY